MTKEELRVKTRNDQILESVKLGPTPIITHPIVVEAIHLTAQVARLITNGPFGQYDPLATQLARSMNSVASNFTEGLGRGEGQSIVNFLSICRASAYESLVHIETLGRLRDVRGLKDRMWALALEVDKYFEDYLTK